MPDYVLHLHCMKCNCLNKSETSNCFLPIFWCTFFSNLYNVFIDSNEANNVLMI